MQISSCISVCTAIFKYLEFQYPGSTFLRNEYHRAYTNTIGGSRGVPAHAPLHDPILSFSHTFLPKSARIRGSHPPNGSTPPYGKSWICQCIPNNTISPCILIYTAIISVISCIHKCQHINALSLCILLHYHHAYVYTW